MNKKEKEAHVRSVTRLCRGPLPAEAREEVNALLAAGKAEEARAADAAGRGGCGADFNDTILAGPLDGKVHEYTCPWCGLQGTYRAPLFD